MRNLIHTYIAEKATSGKEEVRGKGKDENKEYGFQQNVLESESESKEEEIKTLFLTLR